MIDNKKIPESEFVEMKKFAQKNGFDFCRWGFLDRAKNVKKFRASLYKYFEKDFTLNQDLKNILMEKII